MIQFKPWPKIPRLENEEEILTEKIDGTNACVAIDEEGNIAAQSRNRFIFPNDDNYGFAKWVEDNKEDLLSLGPGHHYGEWWGRGIGRGYDQQDRHFSLFNVHKWGPHNTNTPKCCLVVPTLDNKYTMTGWLNYFKEYGSIAVPGYLKPEGIIVYKSLTKIYYKIILDK